MKQPFLLAAILIPLTQSAPAPLPPVKHRVAVIAHRGGVSRGPENTMSAIRKSITLGVDYVEIDVRRTKDGELVIIHDSKVDRTTNGKGVVREMTLAELRTLDASNRWKETFPNEQIPTLEEVLVLCKGKVNIYLDHKEAPVLEVLAMVRKHKFTRNTIVYAGIETLQEWKRLAPEIPVMPSLPRETRLSGDLETFKKTLAAEVVDGNLVEWTADLVARTHNAAVKVYVDNLGPNDNAEGFQKAIDYGVDGIQTDHPEKLLAFLKRLNTKRDPPADPAMFLRSRSSQ